MAGTDKNRLQGPQDDLGVLFKLAQAGDRDAQAEVFRQCEAHVKRAISKALGGALAGFVDADDFVGETFKAAFKAGLSAARPDSPQAVLSYLDTIALNKVRDELRHGRTARFRHDHDISLENVPATSPIMELNMQPDQQLLMDELINITMAGWAELLPNGLPILVLLGAGKTRGEIAGELSIGVRMVQRVCAELERRLREESGGRKGGRP